MNKPRWGERLDEVATIIAKATGTYFDFCDHPKPVWAIHAARAVCAHFDAVGSADAPKGNRQSTPTIQETGNDALGLGDG